MWKLVIEDDEGKRTVVHLSRDSYTVGRKEGSSIRLTERNVSREHAKLVRSATTAGSFLLDDVSSYNGVYINGIRVAEPQEMVNGDLIQIGDYRIIIQDERVVEPAPDPAQEVDVEDLKSTVAPGKIRRGSLLLERPNRLVMLMGPTPGYEYALTSERSTIGRGEEQSISVNHNSVSRAHCEIHQLAEGRYEIVDLASANGVRVNGGPLTRGFIEAGDLIELGDVRFKFIAAGQVFLANASDSQQLMAISDRQAEGALAAPARKRSAVPFLFGGVLLGALIVGGFYMFMEYRNGTGAGGATPNGTSTTTSSATTKPTATASHLSGAAASERDIETLNQARRLSQTNIDKAHADLATIDENSPLRNTVDFKQIESQWADAVIERAMRESDVKKRRALLESVVGAATVDDARRDQAKNQLSKEPPAPADTANPASPTATASATATTTAAPGKSAEPATAAVVGPNTTTTPAPTAAGAAAATASAKPPGKLTNSEKARAALLDSKFSEVKGLLLNSVKSGHASAEDVGLLRAACKALADAQCLSVVNQH